MPKLSVGLKTCEKDKVCFSVSSNSHLFNLSTLVIFSHCDGLFHGEENNLNSSKFINSGPHL